MDLASAREIFEARLLIEPYLAGRAALHIQPPDIERLKTLAEAMLAIRHYPARVHRRILRGVVRRERRIPRDHHGQREQRAPRPLVTIGEGNAAHQVDLRDTYGDANRERSARQHFEIVSALEQRNATWAEAITRCHILAAEKAVIDRYDREHQTA